MDQPAPGGLSEFMSFAPEPGTRFAIDEAFAREKERNIPLLIEENLARSKGVFVCYPARVDADFRHKMRSRNIKAFMYHATCHGHHQVSTFLWWSQADHSIDARHAVFSALFKT
jgi:hypothetical protein